MRHVISLFDLTADEIRTVLDLSIKLKQQLRDGEREPLMQQKTMGLLFQKPSLRTRVSFETLFNQMAGSTMFLSGDVGWNTREPVQDFMPILTGYLDLLVIRAKNHNDVVEAAQFSQCPIINGLTDVSHPCQALADVMTVMELCDSPQETLITYVGDANNVAYSLAVCCSRLGIRLNIAAPAGYQFESSFISSLNVESGNDFISQTDDPRAAVENASFIYTDVWTSMGQEAENEKRVKDLADYQVNEELFKVAADGARLLHCLPARRGEEVTSSVIDSPDSAVIEQADNRLHAQKGLVVWLMDQVQE
ncbi:MAG: ornithine carbamoyltransferase [Planctomycetota bacterium]